MRNSRRCARKTVRRLPNESFEIVVFSNDPSTMRQDGRMKNDSGTHPIKLNGILLRPVA